MTSVLKITTSSSAFQSDLFPETPPPTHPSKKQEKAPHLTPASLQIVQTYLLLEQANALSAQFLQELLILKNEDFQLFIKEQITSTKASHEAKSTQSFLSTLQSIITTLGAIVSISLGVGCTGAGASPIGIPLMVSGSTILANEVFDLLQGWQFLAELLSDDLATQETFVLFAKPIVTILASLTSLTYLNFGAQVLPAYLADVLKGFSSTASFVTQTVGTVGGGYGRYKSSISNQLCEENKKNIQALRQEDQDIHFFLQDLAKEQSLATKSVSAILSTPV